MAKRYLFPSGEFIGQAANSLSGNFIPYFEGSDAVFFIGPYYRNKDAMILHIGGTYGEYIFRISYDINVSSLSSVSRSRGGFELSITYTKEKAKYIPSIY